MSKLSLIERNKKRIKLYKKYKAKHDTLLKQANNKKLSPEEQFQARLKPVSYTHLTLPTTPYV